MPVVVRVSRSGAATGASSGRLRLTCDKENYCLCRPVGDCRVRDKYESTLKSS